MLLNSMNFIKHALETFSALQERIQELCGQPLNIVPFSAEEAAPPCAILTPDGCTYALNGGGASSSVTLYLTIPIYDGDPIDVMCDFADIIGQGLYFAAGRSSDGLRISGVTAQGFSEDEKYPGLWRAAFNITISR